MVKLPKSLCVFALLVAACRTTSGHEDLASASGDGQGQDICDAFAKQPTSPTGKSISALIKSMHSRDCLDMAQKIGTVTSLTLVNQGLSDLTLMTRALNLEYLDVSGNNLTTLAPLSGLTKLKYLGASQNKIKSIPTNPDWHAIHRLDLSSNVLDNIDGIGRVSALEWLNISDNKIADLSTASGSKNLKILEANNNVIANIESLSSLKKLEQLYVANNQIRDLSPLVNLQNLRYTKYFDVSDNPIEKRGCPILGESEAVTKTCQAKFLDSN